MTGCKNCQGPVSELYCSRCGQRHIAGRLTVKLLRDEAQGIFARAFLKTNMTAWRMLWAPGPTINDYLDGRRRTYQEPLSFFAIGVSAYFALAALSSALLERNASMFHWGALPPILVGSVAMAWILFIAAACPGHSFLETLVAVLYSQGTAFFAVSAFIGLQVALSPALRAVSLDWPAWSQVVLFHAVSGGCLIRLALSWQVPLARIALAIAAAEVFFLGYLQFEGGICAYSASLPCRH